MLTDARRELLQRSCKIQPMLLNCVSCFNAGPIFVGIFKIKHRTVMKFGMNIEAKRTNDV